MGINWNRIVIASAAVTAVGLVSAPAARATEAAEETTGGLQTITVTAQKRVENLQDVPASISAVTEDRLAAVGLTSTIQLAETTPGVTIGRTAAWTNFYMRGIGNSFNTPAAQSPVAMYIDGVYEADAAAMALGLDNVERVELLKGPQGTLYGRNAVGGAINIITKAPTEGFEAKVRATAGNLSDLDGSAYLSGGNSVFQANLAVDRHTRDGIYRNLAPGGRDQANIDDTTARVKLRYTPSDRVDLTLAADYSLQEGRGPGTAQLTFEPHPNAFLGAVVPTAQLFGGLELINTPWRTANLADLSGRARDEGLALTGRFHLDNFDLVSISAGRSFHNDHGVDFDSSNPTVTEWRAKDSHSQFTQEFQIVSTSAGKLDWIAGLYYLHDDAGFDQFRLNQFANFGGVFVDLATKVRDESYAAYAEATYKFNDAWSVIVGGRFSKDDENHYLAQQKVTLAAAPVVLVNVDSGGSSHSWSAFTPRLSVKYQRDEGIYYATISKGYSAGLYNITNVAPTAALDQPINPETVKAGEIGAKWTLLDRRLRLNAAAFYYDIGNLQTQQLAGSGFTTFQNADAKSKGVDVDALWAATQAFTIRAGFEYLDAKYSAYHTASIWVPNLQQGNRAVPPCGGQNGATPFDAACVGAADLTGDPVMRSPKVTSTLGFDWDLPVLASDKGRLTLTTNWYHSDEYWLSNNGTIVSPAYDTFGLVLAFHSADNRVLASLWGNNLSNAKYFVTGGEANYGRTIALGDPRTYGITLSYHFK
jgi:iron complex outermembrane recepter protein